MRILIIITIIMIVILMTILMTIVMMIMIMVEWREQVGNGNNFPQAPLPFNLRLARSIKGFGSTHCITYLPPLADKQSGWFVPTWGGDLNLRGGDWKISDYDLLILNNEHRVVSFDCTRNPIWDVGLHSWLFLLLTQLIGHKCNHTKVT